MDAYRAMCAEAERDFEGFWARHARAELLWKKPFTQTLDESNAPFFKWFHDGELNASYNCLDRHLATQPDKVAIIFEADDGTVTRITYKALYHEVCRFANALKAKGIQSGDRVLVYMPMSIQAVVAMQACARIGATHSVVFGGFSAKSIQERIVDAGAVAVITADGQFRGGREIPLKPVVDEALAMGGCEGIKHRLRLQAHRLGHPDEGRPRRLVERRRREPARHLRADVGRRRASAVHPLHVGLHRQAEGRPALDRRLPAAGDPDDEVDVRLQADDVFWCTADVGWVTGHTYIAYGPLACGATEIVFEGVPTYPDAGRFWKMIQDHKVTVFYTAPTAIRSLIKAGGDLPKKYDLSKLRILGTVGEPINPEAWMWYYETVGNARCPIVDTWWQTETGGHMITPLPGATPLKPGSCTFPLPGIIAEIVDETGHAVEFGKGGILVIKRPWPGMIRTIWGDPERFKKSYYPEDFHGKYYLAGDGASRDLEGYIRIMGRIDDVLNVSGHRLGTMEIESALVANPLVAEAAVVGRPDDLTGEAVCAFVVLKQARPEGAGGRPDREGAARLGRQGDRPDRQAEGHPLRREPAEDALRQDHAPAAAVDRQGRGDQAGHFHAGESRDPRPAEAAELSLSGQTLARVRPIAWVRPLGAWVGTLAAMSTAPGSASTLGV